MEGRHWKNIVFGPCTLGRTWGTRPEPLTVVKRLDSPAYLSKLEKGHWFLSRGLELTGADVLL